MEAMYWALMVTYGLGLTYVIGIFPYMLGAEQSAESKWPPITALIILIVLVPALTSDGLQQHEEGRLFLIVPFFLGSAALGLLTGWIFRKPEKEGH